MDEPRRVALISGASRGIGAATAREMGRRGYHVVVNYRQNAAAAQGVVDEIKAAGGSAEARRADVCDGDQVGDMVERVLADHGHIDVLICNANTVNPPFEPLLSVSWDAFIGKVSGELAGSFFLTRHVLPVMQRRGEGRIVYISSTAADLVGSVAAHSTAKAALNTFSRHVAAAAAQHGVVVNTVAFGTVRTDATAGVLNDDLRKFTEERSVLGRLMDPEDAARSVAAVADDGFGAAVGQVIRVDGGFDVLDQQLHTVVKHFQ
ncbi:3-oxoacyl-[acyl-carrier protein] reductase [Thermomonospora echinospora]|uniref:3-oxoacyl-[acyl-carrier protein] reductase n=1 Tax=Thermomonospora echinospora TaxID=1992 RepID=A0A1H6DZN1_9ACTN|nr:SDR family oxidoreductase [Thermomonospora echinospora]SEG90394.1 3-oxoacyl-[acyl-carrier protein] reductase [Thermomonospora echinospora]